MTRLPVAPKHALGQHFLADPNILRVIERLAELEREDIVLEIGSGLGALTAFLASRVGLVYAVEIDRSLEPHLQAALAGQANVRLIFQDALSLDPSSLDPAPGKLVSNLPYNVAVPILLETIDRMPTIELWCVMVQREIADRLFARPGSKAYGAVSVLVQLAAERAGFHPVSREVFRPRPRVDSALVAFRRRPLPPRWPQGKALGEAAFSHRRKTLPNSLQQAGFCDRERAARALATLGRSPSLRAEELSPHDFLELARLLP